MTTTQARLILIQVPAALRERLKTAFSRIWKGPITASDATSFEGVPPAVAVVAAARAQDAWRTAAEVARSANGVPIMAVVQDAMEIRVRRAIPREVAWVASPKELEPGQLAWAVRFVIMRERARTAEAQLAEGRYPDMERLLSNASHEISNPLTSLLTNMELVLSEVASAASGRGELQLGSLLDAVREAYVGAKHVSRIAEDLGRVSRRGGRVVALDVQEVVETARRLSAQPLQGVAVRFDRKPTPPVRADETRLCQVFINLLKNAAVALEGRQDPQVSLTVSQDRDDVVVRIADNGPGIEPRMARQLFRRGTTNRSDGSGLGLPLSRRFVEDMGGTLELIEGRPGATFDVRLPIARDVRTVRPTLVPAHARVAANVLVVDDTPMVGRAFQRALRERHTVSYCRDVKSALSELERERFDVALVDLRMPHAGGIDFHQEVLARHPDLGLRVVFLSGAFSDEDLSYMEAHQLRWVRKPVGAEQLRNLVQELLSDA